MQDSWEDNFDDGEDKAKVAAPVRKRKTLEEKIAERKVAEEEKLKAALEKKVRFKRRVLLTCSAKRMKKMRIRLRGKHVCKRWSSSRICRMRPTCLAALPSPQVRLSCLFIKSYICFV